MTVSSYDVKEQHLVLFALQHLSLRSFEAKQVAAAHSFWVLLRVTSHGHCSACFLSMTLHLLQIHIYRHMALCERPVKRLCGL